MGQPDLQNGAPAIEVGGEGAPLPRNSRDGSSSKHSLTHDKQPSARRKEKKRKREHEEKEAGKPQDADTPLRPPSMERGISEWGEAEGEEPRSTPAEDRSSLEATAASGGGEGDVEKTVESPSKPKKAKLGGGKAPPILPWMRVPIEIEGGGGVALGMVHGLHANLLAGLQKRGYKELFPVQAASWRTLAGGMSQAHDLCICAPTGSGKTLAYALPVLQSMIGMVRNVLGALVVLPTRELAVQVYDVFAALSPGMGLWTAVAAARVSLAAEAAALGECPPNVLIATPGRLMSHVKDSRISLSGLRFLVVDETDRLLRQAYQDWLPYVIEATTAVGASHPSPLQANRVVKILVSATLTQDPAKMERLRLVSPRYISMSASDHRYKVPKQLKEYKLVGASVDKPVLLLALLKQLSSAKTIVFTASLPATHRLFLVLHELLGDEVIEHSSTSSASGKHTADSKKEATGLAAFKAGRGSILVATDAATRGMDVPGVEMVVNYDSATYPKTYIHRAGRTARAGKAGTVVTLLSTDQVHHFKAMLRKVDNTFVKDYPIPSGLVASLRPDVKQAMERAASREDQEN